MIYGFLAAAFVLAPRARVESIVILGPYVRYLDLSLRWLAVLLVGLELVQVLFELFSPSSALLHLSGAAVGLPLAVLGLKLGWLDAGGWDALSLRAGRLGA